MNETYSLTELEQLHTNLQSLDKEKLRKKDLIALETIVHKFMSNTPVLRCISLINFGLEAYNKQTEGKD